MRRWRLQFSSGTCGCAVCGAKDKGNLVSPGFPSFGSLWCIACMYVGGKISLTSGEISTLKRRGHLQSSIEAFLSRGMHVENTD
jgi:hypothetical protein